MARSRETIQATMDAEQALQTNLSTLNSPSTTSIYTLWKFITSSIINYFEQLWDLKKIDLETVVLVAPAGNGAWVQDRILKFQYDAVTPQVLEVDSNFAINYTLIDATKRIITRCSVTTKPTKIVAIKVAKSEPPVALSAPELASLGGYWDDLNFAGVGYTITSLTGDKLFLEASIYYDGQYAAVISANVIASINAYLAAIPFDGAINIQKLTDSIQSVTGVNDVILVNVALRADATAFASKTYLVLANTTVYRSLPSTAGYIVEEDTALNTFTDKLTFIAS